MSPVETRKSSAELPHTLRILDANANRATEGLRVVEEYLRFGLDDGYLTGLCKQLRHDLATALANVPKFSALAARETQHDVGTSLTTSEEFRRGSLADTVTASFHRVQQALRCLEEYSKPHWPDAAVAIESLRYRSYTLQRIVAIGERASQRLSEARLYVLVDGRGSAAELAAMGKEILEGGADVIQLREKTLDDRELVERARLLRRITRHSGRLFIVNDRPDIALLADADGVHVGQSELTVKDARSVVGPDRLVGVSTHSLEQARQAVLDGADYLGCGPTFPSRTKAFESFPGLDFLHAVSREIRLPSFAIGGVGRDQVAQVLATGFRRIAVSSAVVESADPAREARFLRALLG